MKRVLLMLTLVSIITTACAQKKSGSDKNNAGANTAENSTNKKEVEHLSKALFIQKVWDYSKSTTEWKYIGSKPAIIDFYADWCQPCKIAGPILEEIAYDYADKLVVYKINTDNERELAQLFGISGIPAFLFIPVDGKPTMTSGIARSKDDTKKMFIEYIEKYLSVKN